MHEMHDHRHKHVVGWCISLIGDARMTVLRVLWGLTLGTLLVQILPGSPPPSGKLWGGNSAACGGSLPSSPCLRMPGQRSGREAAERACTTLWVDGRCRSRARVGPAGSIGVPGGVAVLHLRGGSSRSRDIRATVDLVVRALEVLHDPTQDNNNRRAAQEHCDRIKGQVGRNPDVEGSWGDSVMLCKMLTDSEMPETVRHYGYQLLEHLATKKWSTLGEDAQAELRQVAVSMLISGTKSILEEKRYIKEKAVQVVTRVLRNDWPQRWPDALSSVRALTLSGDTQCELALLVLKALPDDVYSDGVSVPRRNEMLSALHKEMPAVLDYLSQIMSRTIERQQSAERVILLDALCGAFEAYANVATSAAMAECGAAPLLHSLLRDPRLRMPAADALLAVVSKKSRAEPGGVAEKSMNEVAGLLLETCASIGACDDADEYKITKRVVQVICELGVNHASVLAANLQTAMRYMILMNRLASHPCVRIPAMTLSFWGSLVEAQRNMGGRAPSYFTSEYRGAFVGNWVAKMVSPIMTELDEIEFVDEEEWKAASSASQVRFLDILRKMSSEQPLEMMMQVGGMWQQLLLSKDGTTQSAAHGGSAVSLSQITAVHRALEKVVDAIPVSYYGDGGGAGGDEAVDADERRGVQDGCGEIIRGLLQCCSDANPELRCIVIKAIGFFSTYLQYADEQQLFFTFHKLLTLSGQQSAPGDGPRAARRAASSVLLKIAASCSRTLAPHLDDLVSVVRGLTEGAGGEERGQLAEMLFVVSTGLESNEAQNRFISMALGDLCQGFGGGGWDLPRGMLACCFGATTGSQDSEQEARRAASLTSLQAMASLLRRVSQAEGGVGGDGGGGDEGMGAAARPYSTALRSYAPTILEHLLTVTGAVHSFWHPRVRASVSERWKGVYLAPEMKAMVDPSHKPSPLDCGDPQVTDTCSWLRHVRDATYECLALMCDAGAGVHEAAAGGQGGVLEAIGSGWQHLENRHLRQLLRVFLSPFILKCPSHLHSALLLKILPPLWQEILTRLQKGYSAMASGEKRGDGGGEKEEVLEDTALRLLHREALDLVLSISQTSVETGLLEGGGFSTSGVGDIGALLMSCQAASGNVIALLSESLRWPDSIGVSKAVEAAQRLVLGTPSRLSEVDAAYVCRQMMGSALSALRSAESKELYLALITDIFAALGEKNEVAGQVIASAVDMTVHQELIALRAYFFAEGRKEKEQRMKMREVLEPLLRRDPPFIASF